MTTAADAFNAVVGAVQNGRGRRARYAEMVAELCDADEHTVTVPLIDLRAGYVVVDADDINRWPPQRPYLVTATWARTHGLLPW